MSATSGLRGLVLQGLKGLDLQDPVRGLLGRRAAARTGADRLPLGLGRRTTLRTDGLPEYPSWLQPDCLNHARCADTERTGRWVSGPEQTDHEAAEQADCWAGNLKQADCAAAGPASSRTASRRTAVADLREAVGVEERFGAVVLLLVVGPLRPKT